MKLPKSIIKKHGISKKAWRIYKSGLGSTRKSSYKRSKTRRKSLVNVARRRKTRTVYRYAKKRARRIRRGMKPFDLAMGTAVVTFLEPTLDTFLDKFAGQIGVFGGVDMKDVAKVGLGFFMMKRRSKFMKGAGYALMVIGTREVVRSFVGQKVATSASNNWC